MIFFILFLYLVLLSVVFLLHPFNKGAYLFLIFVPLTILLSFRSMYMPICVDTYNYYELFELSKTLDWSDFVLFSSINGAETGYLLVNKVFSLFFDDYYYFQVFTSFVFCLNFAFFIYKNLHSPVIGLILFLGLGIYFAAYNVSRQMLAISIFVVLFSVFRKKSFLPILITVFLSMIHISCLLLFIPILLLYIPEKFDKFVFILFIFLILIYDTVFQYIPLVFTKYEGYLTRSNLHNSSIGFSLFIYLTLLVFSILFFFRRDVLRNERLFALLSMFSILCFLGESFLNYLERIALLFVPYVILTIDSYFNKTTSLVSMRIFKIIFIVIMFVFIYFRFPEEYLSFLDN